jgi:predicted MFS family arabinose efflux permease
MAFGLGVAVGPLAAGILFNLGGFLTPFAFGGVLALLALALTYTQVEDTITDSPV